MYGNVEYPALKSNPDILKKQRKKSGRFLRLKIIFGIESFMLVLLILSLCGLGAVLDKYYKLAKEIEALKEEQKTVTSLDYKLAKEIEALKEEQKTVTSLGSFLLYNEEHEKCADIRSSSVSPLLIEMTVSTCSSDSLSQLFRWIPGGKLLNMKARQCVSVMSSALSLEPLIVLPCDEGNALSWVCANETLLEVRGQSLYFNYGHNLQGAVTLYKGTGSWSRWKSRGLNGALQAGGACAQNCKN